MHDTLHGAAAIVALSLIAGGAWLAFGVGYGMIVCGALLLAAVIYARTRGADVQHVD